MANLFYQDNISDSHKLVAFDDESLFYQHLASSGTGFHTQAHIIIKSFIHLPLLANRIYLLFSIFNHKHYKQLHGTAIVVCDDVNSSEVKSQLYIYNI